MEEKYPIVIDLEAVGEPWAGGFICISIVEPDGSSSVYPTVTPEIQRYLSDDTPIITHSAYDIRQLRLMGYTVNGPFYNTMKMAHILNENAELSLESLALRYCGIKMDKRITVSSKIIYFTCDDGTKVKLEDAPYDEVAAYCLRDSEATLTLYRTLREKLDVQLWTRYWLEEEVPYTGILLDMETRGIPIDLEQASELKAELEVDLKEKEAGLVQQLGYSILFTSATQLRKVMFTDLWLQEDRIPISKEQRDCLRSRCKHVQAEPGGENPPSDCFTLPEDGIEVRSVGTQYAHVLRYRKGLGLDPTPPTEKTKEPSTRTGDLMVAHGSNEFVKSLIQFRKVGKVISTYLNSYPEHSAARKDLEDGVVYRVPKTHKEGSKSNLFILMPQSGQTQKYEEVEDGRWVCGHTTATSPESQPTWQDIRTRLDSRAKTWSLSFPERTSTPRQREQDGQQTGEFVCSSGEDSCHHRFLQTYLELDDAKLHGRFSQAGTVTGRLSSYSPNLENQPAHGPLGTSIRKLFAGRLIVGDHSQLEPRLMAHFSGDEVLLDIYRNNRDIYLVTGEYIFGRKLTKEDEERGICKTLILALGYGAGPPKVAQILCINGFYTTPDRAEEYMDELKNLYHTFFGWKRWSIAKAKDDGYVKTIGGRFRRLKYAFGDAAWKVRSKGERQAVNSIIQGSAADIIRRNMLHSAQLYPDLPLINQVHDELLWEHNVRMTDAMAHVGFSLGEGLKTMCENPGYDLQVPLNFEPSFCSNWAEKGGSGIEIPSDWLEDSETIGGLVHA